MVFRFIKLLIKSTLPKFKNKFKKLLFILYIHTKSRQKTYLGPWFNQTTLPNFCKSSCEMNFLFYKIFCLKFWKIQQKAVKNISQHIIVIIDKSSNFFKIFTKKKLTDLFYILLRFVNFQKYVL